MSAGFALRLAGFAAFAFAGFAAFAGHKNTAEKAVSRISFPTGIFPPVG